jgi:hypothetical protein
MPQREHAIGMLTAGISTRAVARELDVHFSTKAPSNVILENLAVCPTGTRHLTTPAQDRHMRFLHLQDRLTPATQTADETEHFCR